METGELIPNRKYVFLLPGGWVYVGVFIRHLNDSIHGVIKPGGYIREAGQCPWSDVFNNGPNRNTAWSLIKLPYIVIPLTGAIWMDWLHEIPNPSL